MGNFPEIISQQILAGIIFVGGLGVIAVQLLGFLLRSTARLPALRRWIARHAYTQHQPWRAFLPGVCDVGAGN